MSTDIKPILWKVLNGLIWIPRAAVLLLIAVFAITAAIMTASGGWMMKGCAWVLDALDLRKHLT